MHTPIVCGTLMALGIPTAERAQNFHSANAGLPGRKFLVAGAMGRNSSGDFDVGLLRLNNLRDRFPHDRLRHVRPSNVTQGQILQVIFRTSRRDRSG